MEGLQKLALVVSQGWFNNDPRHQLWSTTLRSVGWRVIEVEVVDEPVGFRDLIGADMCGDRLTVRVDRAAASIDPSVPTVTSTGRFIRSSDAVVVRGVALVGSMGFVPRLVVANDLHAGRGAVREWPGSTVVYDAHESFVASFDMLDTQPMSADERSYWVGAEREVMLGSEVNVTVSPGLASHHEKTIGVGSRVVPNYYPRTMGRTAEASQSGPVRFVFVGRFDPHRGIDRLAGSWDVDPSVATLDMYLPDGPGRRYLEKIAGTGPGRARFKDAVDPAKIIDTVASYDVGVIPYDYPHPYSEASPNKFGEYLAAGVAVMANRQGFTSGVIERFGLGAIFDWDDASSFESAIRRLGSRDCLTEIRENVAHAFESELNWDVAVRPVIEELEMVHQAEGSGGVGVMADLHTHRERFGPTIALRSWVIRAGLRTVRRSKAARSLVSRLHLLVVRVVGHVRASDPGARSQK